MESLPRVVVGSRRESSSFGVTAIAVAPPPGSSKHRGADVELWCRCRVVVPAPAVLPLRGALPFREPTPPMPSTTTRRGLDFLGSSHFSSFLSFFPFILPCLLVLFFYPPPSYSFLLCLHSFLFHPFILLLFLCILFSLFLPSILLPYLLCPPSIHVPLQHYHLPSSVCSYSVFSRSRPSPGTRKESDSAGHRRNTSITIFYKSLMHSVVTTAARRAFGELPAAASCSRRAA